MRSVSTTCSIICERVLTNQTQLVIPKHHGAKLTDVPDDSLQELLPVAKKIAAASGAENFNMYVYSCADRSGLTPCSWVAARCTKIVHCKLPALARPWNTAAVRHASLDTSCCSVRSWLLTLKSSLQNNGRLAHQVVDHVHGPSPRTLTLSGLC